MDGIANRDPVLDSFRGICADGAGLAEIALTDFFEEKVYVFGSFGLHFRKDGVT